MNEGEEGGLFERIAGDEELGVTAKELEAMARPERLVGRRWSRWIGSFGSRWPKYWGDMVGRRGSGWMI